MHHSTVNMFEGPKRLWNLHDSTFIQLCCIYQRDWLRAPLFLVIFELLQILVNTLTPDDKYSLCNIWSLHGLIQMQLYNKIKTFCLIFLPFWKSTSNSRHFEEKDALIVYIFPILPTVKDMFRQMFEELHFRAPFESRYVKAYQTLMKSAWHHIYRIFWLFWV